MRFNFINELINAVGTRSPEDAHRHAVAVLSSLTVVSGEHQNHNGKESETSGGLQGSLLLLSFDWWITCSNYGYNYYSVIVQSDPIPRSVMIN